MLRILNLFFPVLMLALGYWLFQTTNLPLYPAWVLTLSVITFFTYGFDKGQSKRKGRRVSERTLHALALAGGFPGGWVGMLYFHHKTKHLSFFLILAASTLLHLYLINAGWVGQ